jgi:hypothetical protein
MARLLVLYATPSDPTAFDQHYHDIHIPLAKKLPGLQHFDLSTGPILAPPAPPPSTPSPPSPSPTCPPSPPPSPAPKARPPPPTPKPSWPPAANSSSSTPTKPDPNPLPQPASLIRARRRTQHPHNAACFNDPPGRTTSLVNDKPKGLPNKRGFEIARSKRHFSLTRRLQAHPGVVSLQLIRGFIVAQNSLDSRNRKLPLSFFLRDLPAPRKPVSQAPHRSAVLPGSATRRAVLPTGSFH